MRHFFSQQDNMSTMKNLIYLLLLLVFFSCKKATSNTATEANAGKIGEGNMTDQQVNISDYKLEDVPFTNWQRAEKRNSAGELLEVGYFENGNKVGSWLLYEHDKKLFPSQLSNYKDGKLNGAHLQFNQGGQIELVAYYQDNMLHGQWGKYRFSRLVEEANYKNGKLEGVYNLYEFTTGKLQTAAEYKNGVQEGFYRTYNTTTGRMTAEYTYKNGLKVSGGAVMQ